MPVRLNTHLEPATPRTATTNPNPSLGTVGVVPTPTIPSTARKFSDVFSFAEDATVEDPSEDGEDVDPTCGTNGDCEENALNPKSVS
jgi:hypothetical protein